MITAKILDWQEVYRPDFSTPERQLWRGAVAEVAKRAKAAMDSRLHGRIDKAQVIVLAGDMNLSPCGRTLTLSPHRPWYPHHIRDIQLWA